MISNDLLNELSVVKEKYPGLQHKITDDGITLRGSLDFFLEDPLSDKPPIYDSYDIEIMIKEKFPEEIPIVKEPSGKIKRTYEHISSDGTLCLEIPSKLSQLLKKYPTIIGFIDKILKPNLYAYSYFEKYNNMPWGDHRGGTEGIINHYAKLFGIKDLYIILRLLGCIILDFYDGDILCPCNSKSKLADCHHGKILMELNKLPIKHIEREYCLMINGYFTYYRKFFE